MSCCFWLDMVKSYWTEFGCVFFCCLCWFMLSLNVAGRDAASLPEQGCRIPADCTQRRRVAGFCCLFCWGSWGLFASCSLHCCSGGSWVSSPRLLLWSVGVPGAGSRYNSLHLLLLLGFCWRGEDFVLCRSLVFVMFVVYCRRRRVVDVVVAVVWLFLLFRWVLPSPSCNRSMSHYPWALYVYTVKLTAPTEYPRSKLHWATKCVYTTSSCLKEFEYEWKQELA